MGISLARLKSLGYNVDSLKPRKKSIIPKGPSKLELQFDRIWAECNGPYLEKEFKFHPDRKWRFDRAFPMAKIAFELHGGVFSGGRHTRGKGFENDREKMNTATMMGWRVLEMTPSQITHDALRQYVALCKKTCD